MPPISLYLHLLILPKGSNRLQQASPLYYITNYILQLGVGAQSVGCRGEEGPLLQELDPTGGRRWAPGGRGFGERVCARNRDTRDPVRMWLLVGMIANSRCPQSVAHGAETLATSRIHISCWARRQNAAVLPNFLLATLILATLLCLGSCVDVG